MAESRAILWDGGASAGSLVVPVLMANQIYEYLEASIAALRMPTTMIRTPSGANMSFPQVATHGIGTQVIAQGTAIGGTDAVFGVTTLNAFKYGQLCQVSSEMVQDSSFDIVTWLARDVARAVGRVIDTDLVVGTGTAEPNGMMTATTQTSNTGGSLINPTFESLINLQHAVVDEYRNRNSAWLMRDATMAVIRKLRGGTEGGPLWQPSVTMGITAGAPDTLLGFPVYTDPNVASIASNAAIIAFGDWSAYYLRTVRDFVFERSDDYAFNTDLVTFRGKWRVDGDLLDTLATNGEPLTHDQFASLERERFVKWCEQSPDHAEAIGWLADHLLFIIESTALLRFGEDETHDLIDSAIASIANALAAT